MVDLPIQNSEEPNDLCDVMAVVRWQREADGFHVTPEISGAGTRWLGARSSRHE